MVVGTQWIPCVVVMQGECGFFIFENQQMKQAESMACLDTWSDEALSSVPTQETKPMNTEYDMIQRDIRHHGMEVWKSNFDSTGVAGMMRTQRCLHQM